MPVSRALRRLLQVLEIEEEQSRLALESTLGELRRLEQAHSAAIERERQGRRLVVTSAQTGMVLDRLAGLEETRTARRHTAALAPMIAETEQDVAELRQTYLGKRVERRQAEALIKETEAKDAIVAGRRSQRTLDDWFLDRLRRKKRTEAQADGADVPSQSRRTGENT
jgi:hypothetical protein